MAVDSRPEASVAEDRPGSGTPLRSLPRPPRRYAVAVALLAGAWVLPILAHLVGLDALMLVVLLAGTASLLRTGRTLLDRLVPAAGALAGLLIAAGLVFSVWPWGLAPVPVAGSTLTVLVLTGLALGRRPQLPLRLRGSDLILLAGTAAAGLVVALPTLRGTPTQDLAYSAINGDRMRHTTLFDAIGRVGGYTFLDFDRARSIIDEGTGRTYPSGMHYLYALIESFVTGGHPAAGLTVLVHYYRYVLVGYAFFVLATGWAARWAAGPRLGGWRAVLVCAAVTAWLGTGVMTTLVWEAFDPEVLALAFLALAVAILARPPARVGEQLLLTAALVVAVGFAYTLFLPLVGVAALVGMVVYRRRLWRHRWPTLAVLVVAGTVAALPLVVPPLFFHFNAGKQLTLYGFIVPVPKRTLLFVAALAAAGLLVPALRRLPRLQVLAGTATAVTVVTLLTWLYQKATVGATQYYLYKMLQAVLVCYLVAAGTLALRVRDGSGWRAPARWRPAARLLSSATAVVLALVLTGAVAFRPVQFRYEDMRPGPDTNWGAVWAKGRLIYGPYASALGFLNNAGYLGDGKPTLIVFDGNGLLNAHVSLVAATANHQLGLLGTQVYQMDKVNDLVRVRPPGNPDGVLAPRVEASIAALENIVRGAPVPVRVIVSDPLVAQRLRDFAGAEPALRLDVVYLPGLPTEGAPWPTRR